MGKLIDLTGQKLDMVTVLSRAGTRIGSVTWNCLCDCGKEFVVTGNTFSRRKFKSCGCITRRNQPTSRRLQLAGLRFGLLTAVEPVGKSKHGKVLWKCICDCGNEIITVASGLVNGNTASCRCSTKKRMAEVGRQNRKDLTGQKFGRLTAIEISGRKGTKMLWRCLCDCGQEKFIQSSRLINGLVKSCGCSHLDMVGSGHPNYKRGYYKTPGGYVTLTGHPNHPNARKGKISEHTLVMSQMLDRPLEKGESVHHKNGIRDDNRPENLELWIKYQPSGQRLSDRITDAVDLLSRYAPHLLKEKKI